jgi:hypothetical protein
MQRQNQTYIDRKSLLSIASIISLRWQKERGIFTRKKLMNGYGRSRKKEDS